MTAAAVKQWARRHLDPLVAAGLVLLYVGELLRWDAADLALAIPLAVAAAGTLALRRRLPVATFVVVSVCNVAVVHYAPGFDGNSVAFVLVFLLNLWSLGRHARGVEAWLGVVGVLATVVMFVVGDGAHDVSDVFFALAFCGTPWAAGVAVRLRRDREAELAASNAALEEQARLAVATERARIARELHDVVSHAISVSVLQARGGRRMVGHDDEAVRRALDAIETTNASALSDMRSLLSLLRDTEEDSSTREEPQPTLDRLDDLVDQVRGSGLPVDVRVTGAGLVPPGIDLSAYRIVQEALTNVLKHGGPGARATVEITYGAAELDVTVRNTGRVDGHEPALETQGVHNGGHGLIGIRERAAVAGGQVDAGPEADGFAVRARLPYSVGS
jgi:signal transduction histidine kinase